MSGQPDLTMIALEGALADLKRRLERGAVIEKLLHQAVEMVEDFIPAENYDGTEGCYCSDPNITEPCGFCQTWGGEVEFIDAARAALK